MSKAEWIKGKTIEQIVNTPLNDLKKLTDSELRVLVGRTVSAGNKRIRRYQKGMGGELPAGTGITDAKTYEQVKFSTVGKDREQLLQEFTRAKRFFKAETSSLKGFKKVRKETKEALKSSGVDITDLTEKNYARFWEAYKKLKEKHPEIADRNYKYGALDEMKKMVTGKKWFSVDKLVRDMDKKLDEIYEENQEIKSGVGTSGFFEV